MIETKVPKDILKYDTKVILNLNMRQLICFSITTAVDIVVYFTVIKPFQIPLDYVSYIMLLISLPILAFGYIKPMGLPLEKYIIHVIIRGFVAPKWRSPRIKRTYVMMPDSVNTADGRSNKRYKQLVKEHPEYKRYK